MIERIFIPRLLKAPEQQEQFAFEENLADLETLTPVRGEMLVAHRQNYLEVTGTAETIVTLTCDRCLQNYNTRLRVEATELLWLHRPEDTTTLPSEREVHLDELEESLDPHGYFEPETWLYEQLCLEMPLRKVCDPKACPGTEQPEDETPTVDHRWAKLADLKEQLSS